MNDRLLILDDDPQFTAFVGTVARSSGYEVLEVTDPTRLQESLESWSPSHVMVDLHMPGIDGLEALQIIARWGGSAKVVICSAAARDFLEAVDRLGRRLELDMCGIIEKPVGVADLEAFLTSIRDKRAAAASLHQGFDKGFFDEVFATMGSEWVHRGLAILITRIDDTFPEEIPAPPDRRQLARDTHALVSYAGILGFSELSRLCRELEEACNKGEDVSLPLHRAQAASRLACADAREIIAELTDGRADGPSQG